VLAALLRDFGPLVRIWSAANVVIGGGVSTLAVLSSSSEFERTGWLVWGVITEIVLVTVAIVVWVKSFRAHANRDEAT
jgi:hypothetical protein